MDAQGCKIDNNGILPFFNYDKGNTFGSKNEGALYLQSTTTNIHNDYEQPEVELILQTLVVYTQIKKLIKMIILL